MEIEVFADDLGMMEFGPGPEAEALGGFVEREELDADGAENNEGVFDAAVGEPEGRGGGE